MSEPMHEGYRLLEVDEPIEIGDEYKPLASDHWHRISERRAGMIMTAAHAPHRRRIPAATGIEAIVCADIAARQMLGVEKYGTTVADNPLTLKEWLQHAYEECLDQAVYLRRAIDETQNKIS
jgi:hypothetical protein